MGRSSTYCWGHRGLGFSGVGLDFSVAGAHVPALFVFGRGERGAGRRLA